MLSGKTSCEIISGKRPKYDVFKNFWYLAYATSVNNHDKFSPRVPKCIFMGYVENKEPIRYLIWEQINFLFRNMLNSMSLFFLLN